MTFRADFPLPSVVERTPHGEVAMDVYTRLLKDRIIWLGTGINAAVANAVMAQLLYLEHDDPTEDIYMYINSPGGSTDDGMGIYDIMQFVQPDIVTICAGSSYSMATILLCAGARGKRYAMPNAVIHQHPSRSGFSGNAPDVEIQARQLLDKEKRLNEIMAFHTGQPYERIDADFSRDRFFTPQEAVEYGLIDQIISRSPEL